MEKMNVTNVALAAKESEMQAALAEGMAALKSNNFARISSVGAKMKKLEKDYREIAMVEEIEKCKETENPLLEGIRRFDFPCLVFKTDKVDGQPVGYSLATKLCRIDLVKLCQRAGLSTTWVSFVERFAHRISLRVAQDIGVSENDRKTQDKTYLLSPNAAAIKMDVPTTDTQLEKLLQAVVDEIIFVPGPKSGGNIYKVNKYDVKYFLYLVGKEGKERHGVTIRNLSKMVELLSSILNRVITGGKYHVEYKSNGATAMTLEPGDTIKTLKVPEVPEGTEVKEKKQKSKKKDSKVSGSEKVPEPKEVLEVPEEVEENK